MIVLIKHHNHWHVICAKFGQLQWKSILLNPLLQRLEWLEFGTTPSKKMARSKGIRKTNIRRQNGVPNVLRVEIYEQKSDRMCLCVLMCVWLYRIVGIYRYTMPPVCKHRKNVSNRKLMNDVKWIKVTQSDIIKAINRLKFMTRILPLRLCVLLRSAIRLVSFRFLVIGR